MLRGKRKGSGYVPTDANQLVEHRLNECAEEIERAFDADVLAYYGPLIYGVDGFVRDGIESRRGKRSRLSVFINTTGGYIEVVQRIVDTFRHWYQHVEFVVPDHAMSAGTVLVMSGDAIWMDYYSVLGPIDPQVQKKDGSGWVPALGYLEQYNRLIRKDKAGKLTTAEMAFLIQKFDPAELYDYEQSRELSVSLLKEWLVRYKFKDWKITETKKRRVTVSMRRRRAEEIARKLNLTGHWHSHGRGISMAVLRSELNLRIENFEEDPKRSGLIRTYHKFLDDYMAKLGHNLALHTNNKYTALRGE